MEYTFGELRGQDIYIYVMTPGNPCGMGILFFACPKKRTKRKGSPAAETTPFAEVQNRRGKNSLRSNSLPLHPVPHPAARPSGKGPVSPGYISSWKVASQRGEQREQFVGWGEARTPTFKIAHQPATSCTQNIVTDNGLARLCIDISSRVQHDVIQKLPHRNNSG